MLCMYEAPGLIPATSRHWFCLGTSLVAQMVKNPPANAGDTGDGGLIPGLGRSPGEGMATHFSIFAWRIPWTEEPGHRVPMSQTQLNDLAHSRAQIISPSQELGNIFSLCLVHKTFNNFLIMGLFLIVTPFYSNIFT